MEDFGQRLRKLRGQRSQKQVAADMGIPQTTLSTLENQGGVPRGEVVQRLADYYKVPMSYFYERTSKETRVSDAALAWVRHMRKEPMQGKATIATQADELLNDSVKEELAKRIKRHAETPNND